MRKMTKKSKVLAAAGALALVAGGGGAAYAYWTTTGSGGGTADNAAAGDGSLDLTATFDAGLAPGNVVDVAYTAANSSTTGTRVGVLTSYVTTSDAGCLPVWFEVTSVTTDTLVAAGATGVSVGSGTLTFLNSNANQDACKSATITVHVGSV
jgi:hypothetical protein